jgi:alpha-L-rhamnosidase
MSFRTFFLSLILLILLPLRCEAVKKTHKIQVFANRVEGRQNPMAINASNPLFGWAIQAIDRNTKQNVYQIQVSSSQELLTGNKADFWDSGKVSSGQSGNVSYQGKMLPSSATFYWRVRVWCGKEASSWSETQTFGTGLLQESDWHAKWIGLDKTFPWEDIVTDSRLAARYLRKEFQIPDGVTRARLYICGLGMYQLRLNGNPIDTHVLMPVPTDYTQEVKYNVFDVTGLVRAGRNTVGVALGNGRFLTTRQHRKPWKNRTFGLPKMLFQLELTFADGRKQNIVSDETWKVTADGPIRANNEFDGETYDATKEFPGWTENGFDDSTWLPVDLTTDPGENRKYFAGETPIKNEPKTPHGDLSQKQARRRAQMSDNMAVKDCFEVRSIQEVGKDTFILDLGQNFSGWIKIKVQGPRGQTVRLRFAESLNPDGSLYMLNLRGALVTDTYVLKGSGVETWRPSFVFHGFRYAEVTGWPGVPRKDDFLGEFVYDDIASTGKIECSDTTMNQIFRAAWYSIASNYKGMPVDCPQRDERQPWLGDRSTGSYGESFLFDNRQIYAKWMDDIRDGMTQEGQISDISPNYYNYYTDNMTWPGTYLLVSDMLLRQYGDTVTISKHYPYMQRWLKYMQRKYATPEGLMTRDEYGDWCMPPESPELIHSMDTTRITDGTLIATAYYYKMLCLMKGFATVLHLDADRTLYAAQAEKVSKAFQRKFYDSAAKRYSNNTATANILPLFFGITPESERQAVFANIVDVVENKYDAHVCTGLIGTAWLLRTLTEHGRGDLALKIASNRSYPSWGYMISKGATTIWELWNGDTANPWMNSQNHVMLLGDLLIWYFENLAGIKASAPGFKELDMKPEFDCGLSFVNAIHYCDYGLIRSDWHRINGGMTWNIVLPANTEATIRFPAKSLGLISVSGKPLPKVKGITFVGLKDNRAVYRIGSGSYAFRF